ARVGRGERAAGRSGRLVMETVEVRLTITLDEEAAKALAELIAPAIKQATGGESVERKDARLQASHNVMFGGEKPPGDQGLLIDSREAARLLKVSQRTLWRMHKTGEMPPPIRIG